MQAFPGLPRPSPLPPPAFHAKPASYAQVKALGGLKDAPSLCVLDLNLSFNDVTDDGVQPLASLQHAPQLHTFILDLQCTLVGLPAVQVILPVPWPCPKPFRQEGLSV